MSEDSGAPADAVQALVSDEAPTGLHPSGFDPSQVPTLWQRFRWRLVRALAGRDTMMLNCTTQVTGEVTLQRIFASNFTLITPDGTSRLYGPNYIHHAVFPAAQGIAARSDETLQAAQPEGQEPGAGTACATDAHP